MTMVVNAHECLAVLGSSVILVTTVVVAVHILVGQVFIKGVGFSEANPVVGLWVIVIGHYGAVWP